MSLDLARELADHRTSVDALEGLLDVVADVADVICSCFAAGGTLYTLGNGGSAADAQHLTGELIGRFRLERRPLAAVSLTTDPTVMTCIANDYSFDQVFARQLRALARPGDVVVAFTTSGQSPDVVMALQEARARGATTVLLGGGDGGAAAQHADHTLISPAKGTARIQELHTIMLHLISAQVDEWAHRTEAS